MASRSNRRSQTPGDSDSLEVLKPLLVLALFGTILYGAYSIVQKGPKPPATAGDDAPRFAPPQVEFTSVPVGSPPAVAPPTSPPVAPPSFTGLAGPAAPAAPAAQTPAMPPVTPPPPAPVAADTTATFLPAQSAPPPVTGAVDPRVGYDDAMRPDRLASLPAGPMASGLPNRSEADAGAPPMVAPDRSLPLAPSAAFTTAWAEAHDMLSAGRYAEALAALSVWHDDPALGLEESQRLEDLLGQLAGTVIYSQRDLLLPPHVVRAGETLPAIADQVAVPWQLLAKINGIDDPMRLYPGEHVKLVRGPFDATVSVSRRRLTLHVGGNYAGRFSAVVGRQFFERVGASLSVRDVRRDAAPGADAAMARPALVLDDGLLIEPADDPAALADSVPPSSLLVSERDFAELLDILGAGSRVLVRQ